MCRARLGLPLNAIKIGSSVCCLEGDWRAEDTCKRPIACVISSFGGSALVQYFAMLLASSLVSKNPIQCLVVCNKTRLYCMYCLSSRAADLQWWPIIGGLLYLGSNNSQSALGQYSVHLSAPFLVTVGAIWAVSRDCSDCGTKANSPNNGDS